MASTNTQVSTHGSGRAGSSSNIDSEPSVIHSDSQESTQSALRERILYLEQNVVRNNRQHPLSRDREQCKTQEGELLGKRKAIDHELEPVQKRLKEVSARFDELNEEQIRAERKALGISEELWRHFQVFCESLQPKKSVARELLPLNGTQDASYQSYDPDFSIFKKSVGDEEWLSDVNWRCNRVPVYSICGTAIGYSVEYQVLRKDHSGLEWGSSFRAMYDLAWREAKHGSIGAFEMLVALPHMCSPADGWFFEFELNETHSSPADTPSNPSGLWGFQSFPQPWGTTQY